MSPDRRESSFGRRSSDNKWARIARDAWLFAVTVIVLLTVLRVTHDESQTCKIQARGLPAGHELAASMEGIHALLTLSPPAGSPPPPPNVKRIVYGDKHDPGLNAHLAAYLAAEAKQPKTRTCPSTDLLTQLTNLIP